MHPRDIIANHDPLSRRLGKMGPKEFPVIVKPLGADQGNNHFLDQLLSSVKTADGFATMSYT